MTIVCSIPCSCNYSDGGTATTNKTLMSLFVETCITTANGDRKPPTANGTILWFCDTRTKVQQGFVFDFFKQKKKTCRIPRFLMWSNAKREEVLICESISRYWCRDHLEILRGHSEWLQVKRTDDELLRPVSKNFLDSHWNATVAGSPSNCCTVADRPATSASWRCLSFSDRLTACGFSNPVGRT